MFLMDFELLALLFTDFFVFLLCFSFMYSVNWFTFFAYFPL
jgi:hypothetical protein